jgi:hypothetical protein
MSVLKELASSLGRRDEVPNQELAQRIADTGDKAAVKELAENLENKSKDIRHDCIKTLYEIGYKKPELIAPYAGSFIKMLDNKQPRMVWGAMTALSAIASETPAEIYKALPKIMDVADHSGSVIARDHAMYILGKLGKVQKYYKDCVALTLEQLMKAPVNQLPMYAEITGPMIQKKDAESFASVLNERLLTIEQEPKRKRILKVLKSLST